MLVAIQDLFLSAAKLRWNSRTFSMGPWAETRSLGTPRAGPRQVKGGGMGLFSFSLFPTCY